MRFRPRQGVQPARCCLPLATERPPAHATLGPYCRRMFRDAAGLQSALGNAIRFVPNSRLLLLAPEERNRFIYPADWDLSQIEACPSRRSAGRSKYVEADKGRLYGDM